jgi:lipoyl(octanoyl) transferase
VTVARPAAIGTHELRADRHAPVRVVRAGTVGYLDAWDLQRRLVARRQADTAGDVLVLLEHPPVYTLGSRADRTHVLLDEAELAVRGIEVVQVDRGGDVTYHGPGQLVGYPVLKLASVRGVVDYVRALEEVLIRTAAAFGVTAERSSGLTGVWVGDRKLAAIGVRVASRGVTSHGFALNVTTDLHDFDGIVPCGIPDRGVCSLASLGVDVTVDQVAVAAEAAVADVFGATLETARLVDVDPTSDPLSGSP